MHDLIAYGHAGLRLLADIDLIAIDGVGWIIAPGHNQAYNLLALGLLDINRDFQGWRDFALDLGPEDGDGLFGVVNALGRRLGIGADPDVNGAAISVGEGHHVGDDGIKTPASASHFLVEGLDNAGPLLSRCSDIVEGSTLSPIGPGEGEIVAKEDLAQGFEADLWQQHLGDPVSHAQGLFVLGIAGQAVAVGALDAAHGAGVLWFGAVKEGSGCAPALALQVRYL